MFRRKPLDQPPMVRNCFSFLPIKAVFKAATVCKSWKDVAYNMPKDTFDLLIETNGEILGANCSVNIGTRELPQVTQSNLFKFVKHVVYEVNQFWCGDLTGMNFPNVLNLSMYVERDSLPESIRDHINQHAHLFEFAYFAYDVPESITFPNVKIIDVSHIYFNNYWSNFPNAETIMCDEIGVPLNMPERIKTLVVGDPYENSISNWNAEYIEVLYLPIPTEHPHLDILRGIRQKCKRLTKVIFTGDGDIPAGVVPPSVIIERGNPGEL